MDGMKRVSEETVVKVFLFKNAPKHGQATGHFFRIQVNHGHQGKYIDVDAKADKLKSKIAIGAGAVAEAIQAGQAAKKGGAYTQTPIDPDLCAQRAVEAFDEIVAETPAILTNPYGLL